MERPPVPGQVVEGGLIIRRISCDPFEFDTPDSEESLELAIASPSYYCPDLRSLLSACGASAVHGPAIAVDWPGWRTIALYLPRFAGLELPRPTALRESVLLRDDWDDVEVGIAYGSVLLWYHWSTTA
jgi:hypothetical protein